MSIEYTLRVRPDPGEEGHNCLELKLPDQEIMVVTERRPAEAPEEDDRVDDYTMLYFAGERIVELEARLEAAERERVPRFKFDGIVQHCARQDRELAKLRYDLKALNYGDMDDVWFWQGDGTDHLESLTRPVVIPASTLRDLIGAQPKEPAND